VQKCRSAEGKRENYHENAWPKEAIIILPISISTDAKKLKN